MKVEKSSAKGPKIVFFLFKLPPKNKKELEY